MATEKVSAGSAGLGARRLRRPPAVVLGMAVVALVLTAGPTGALGSAVHFAAGPSEPLGPRFASAPLPSAARSWGHPLANVSNYSWCDPLPPRVNVVNLGVNFSFVVTPSNGSGYGPLNFTWNTTVLGGGLPPYQMEIWIWQPVWEYSTPVGPPNSSSTNLGAYSFNSSAFAGNVTLLDAGMYLVFVEVGDASCSQVSGDWTTLHVWSHPVGDSFWVSAPSGNLTVPANVTYSVRTVPNYPSNWSVIWEPSYLFSNNTTTDQHVYYLPGAYFATACAVEASGVFYTCATSNHSVDVVGPGLVATSVRVAGALAPTNLTFSASVANASALPNGTVLWITANNGTNDSVNFSQNGSVNLTERVPCGPPTTYVPPSGKCTWVAWVDLIAPPGSPDQGALGQLPIFANVSAPGGPANWYPTVSYSYGPTNTTAAPLNLTLNVSLANGLGPYTYSWLALGRSTVNVTGAFYQPLAANGSGWNGSRLAFTIPLNYSGVYWVELVVGDSDGNVLAYALPLVFVAYAPVAPPGPSGPLAVQASSSYAAGTAITSGSVSFIATASSGRGPYTVQWAFGDGAYASSILGQEVTHTYTHSGTYGPTVTVTDGYGRTVSVLLPRVTVVLVSGSGATHGAPAAAPSALARVMGLLPPWGWFGLAAVLSVVGYLLTRREIGREGERLVQELERSSDPSGRDGSSP
ncbi:MAG TPA: PKD domain-containing protein [Thermoplasmata archaeon]|nr:PKD domain-containing protein [Thermoplasmata archaeon]